MPAQTGRLPAQVVAVISNKRGRLRAGTRPARPACPRMAAAQTQGAGPRASTTPTWPSQVAAYQPDWIVLAGWMRLLIDAFLEPLSRPGDQPAPGPARHIPRHARHRARLSRPIKPGRSTHTGVMVHLVPDEGVDSGPVLAPGDRAHPPGRHPGNAGSAHPCRRTRLAGRRPWRRVIA